MADGSPVTDRAVVMGVLNVTADSFSDGGRYLDLDSAVARGRSLVAGGADLIDVGGESTRPGAHRVSPELEEQRVVPVIAELARAGVVCSVDTTRSAVAAAALDAGARIVNDVSGGLADPEMAAVVAQAGVPWILMHWRGHSVDMDALARYDDVVAEVRSELLARVDAALAAGVQESAIVLDPGLGFAKTAAHNWSLLRALPTLTGLDGPGWGFPVLIGASRKRFLGTLLADSSGIRSPDGREDATTAISALAAADGVWGVRVHEAAASLDAVRVAAATTGRGPVRTLAYGVVKAGRSPAGDHPSMADRITLTGLTVFGHHGVFDHEKRDGQNFVVDVTLWLDLSAAAVTDDLARTVHYGELAEVAAGVIAGPARDLIEAVAGEIAEAVLAKFPVDAVEVTIHKPSAPIPLTFTDVSVTLYRSSVEAGTT